MSRQTSHSVQIDRRRFLAATTAACWPFLDMRIGVAADRRVRLANDPFSLGVASGDPTPDGIVLWTRLAPEPLQPDGGMPPEDVRVEWQIANDEKMSKVVRKGVVTAPADWAHSVHVEVDGLEPDRVYWYQFKHGTDTSPIGRTRTAPRADALLDEFRFAFASCQHYEMGYFNVLEHMAQDDLRVVVHLGDYIYEYGANTNRPRQHVGGHLRSLTDYRIRYGQYKLDPNLQAAHQAFPWIVTWDDHEVENNYVGLNPQKSKYKKTFPQQRANAYKAYYEHLPLRRATLPRGPDMLLYRNIPFGRLLQFSVLDTRQYRSDQPCGDDYQPPCEGVYDPQATVLGDKQERWLQRKLSQSSAQWNVLAQQVMIARADSSPFHKKQEKEGMPVWGMDKWNAYDVARKRLLQFLVDREISNPIVLTGDVHKNWVNDLKVDFDDENAPTIATEFVGTSISSGGDGKKKVSYLDELLSKNPFTKFFSNERGYVRCHVTSKQWQSDYRAVEIISKPNQPCFDRASFVVEDGRRESVRV